MVSYCGIQEYQCKLWGYFEHECKERGVRIPAERDLLDVIRRVHVLQKDHLKYKITLQNVKTLYWGTDRGPLWEDKGGESSSSRAIEGASRSNEEEEEESDSDEEEVVEVVKVKKKKQAKVVEVEESEDDEEEEEDAEEEANAGHSQAEHHVEAEGASQQRNSQTDAAARTAANNQDDTPRGAKRNATFLIEAGGKRMRIGMPPKGTEIIFDPKDETVRIKF